MIMSGEIPTFDELKTRLPMLRELHKSVINELNDDDINDLFSIIDAQAAEIERLKEDEFPGWSASTSTFQYNKTVGIYDVIVEALDGDNVGPGSPPWQYDVDITQ